MFKRIVISLVFIILISFGINGVDATCSVDSGIDGCLNNTTLVNPGDATIEEGFKQRILYWTYKIAGFLGLMAVGAIVWGSFMMVISTGEEEKIKKAKDMIKWSILGFLGITLAGALIAIVVNFMYDL